MDFEIFIPMLFMSFIVFVVGLMFFEGRFHGENTKLTHIFDIDKVFFPSLDNQTLTRSSDSIGFIICLVCSIIMLLLAIGASTGLLDVKISLSIINVILLMAIVGSWISKYIFMLIYRNASEKETPVVWQRKRDNM